MRQLACLLSLALVAGGCSGSGDPALTEPAPAPSPTVVSNELPPTPTPEPIPDDAIKVGVLLDTGGRSPDSQDPGNVMSALDRAPGVAFAAGIAAINEEGGLLGRPVSLIEVDTTSRLSVVDAASADMIDAGVDLIVVTCELDFAEPAIRRAEPAGVLVISPCASEPAWSTGEVGELAFSMVPPVSAYGAAMADHMWDRGYRTVAVISDRTAPEARAECDSFSERWAELGGTITYAEAFSLAGADNFDDNTEVRGAADADAIAFCAFATIGKKLLAGIRQVGIDIPVVAGPSFDTGTWLPLDFPGLGDFSLLTLSAVRGDDPSPRQPEAVQGFTELDNAMPQSGRFVVGADLADLWAQAVRASGSVEGAAVARALREMRDVQTVSGRVSFGGAQAPLSRELRVLTHRNGELVFDSVVAARQSP